MKIGIDGAPLTIPFPCGTKRYARELLHNLSIIDKENEYVVFAGREVTIPKQKNFRLVKIPQWLPVLKRQLFLASLAQSEKVDVFHYLEPYGAYFFSHPKIVTTVHDVDLDYTYPWRSKKWLTRAYCEVTRRGVLGKTKVCICVSKTIGKETRKYLTKIGSQAEVKTIYQGFGYEFTDKKEERGTYLLTMGDFTPRKNVERVMEAFSRLSDEIQRMHQLVVVVSDMAFLPRFEDKVNGLGLRDRVRLRVNVSGKELVRLYQEAMMFLYPSLYEGFGLPILEAMASGCPVITTDWGAMKEVAGKAAVLVDTTQVETIRKAMLRVSNDAKLRVSLQQRGLVRANDFSWMKTAKETLVVYRKVGVNRA
jgi:glycosyltransferase involved in cell wall biosynthesis